MGRSAKMHKRAPKKATSGTTSSGANRGEHTAAAAQAKKKAGLKEKAVKLRKPGSSDEPVLGGADYVDIMMGGRRKAREAAKKLPREE
ncbi:hypothetical protein DENSPDRAFT_879215 [Dentipellis sp. KUC8613]|nr:hypothetical protein DENSPDRAFT_879215 [Dentipellis sp. KUC8613]